MVALLLCFIGFLAAFLTTRKNFIYGLITVLTVGYVYGLVRAQFPTAFSHFIFDATLVGFYLSYRWGYKANEARTRSMRSWVSVLIGWPLLIFMLPFQTIMISLVGLRGNIFMLPLLLVGSRLRPNDLTKLATAVALLNLVAFSFGVGEYFLGVERFYPENAATRLIYQANDVAGYKYFRIPATFTNAHVFGGTMVISLPLLFGLLIAPQQSKYRRILAVSGILTALFGVLLSSTRMNFVIAAVLILFTLVATRIDVRYKITTLLLVLALLGPALNNDRFNRFKTLGDTGKVGDRITGSVNRTFIEALTEYPMGNGLGGGGTSIPYFLEHQLNRPITMESEYGRILLEQGIIGLILWTGFVLWFVMRRRIAFSRCGWQLGRQLGWLICLIGFVGALIGVGLLLAIPQSAMFVLLVGWVTSKQAEQSIPGPAMDNLTIQPQLTEYSYTR